MPYDDDGLYVPDPEVDMEENANEEAAPTAPESAEPAEEPVTPPGEETPPEEGPVDTQPEPSEDVFDYVKRLENRVHAMHRRLDKLNKPAPQPKLPKEIKAEDGPKADDFETTEDFEKARTQFEIDRRINDGIRSALERKPSEDLAAEREHFKTTLAVEGPAQYKDFQEVVTDPTLPITIEMVDAVREMDNENVTPADMLYYLGKNPAEAARLSRLSTVQVTREMMKLESQVAEAKAQSPPSEKPADTPKPQERVHSNAPEPINPVESAVIITKDPNKMTQAEYEAWRRDGNG
jgi:hypothetical protein